MPPVPSANQHLAPSGQPGSAAFGEPLCGRPDPLGATIDPDTVRLCLVAACLAEAAPSAERPPAPQAEASADSLAALQPCHPQGATNFAVFASNAWGMSLCLFTEADLRAGRVTHEVALHPQARPGGRGRGAAPACTAEQQLCGACAAGLRPGVC